MQILPPSVLVDREHQDRKKRLARLARIDGVQPPEIYEDSVRQAEHGLASYPVSIPILRVVFRDRAFFDFDSTDLRPEADAVLSTIADTLSRDPPDVTLFVARHPDAIGTWDYNQSLGLKRAKAVVAALIQKKGLARAQLFVVSFGKAVPIDSNDTEYGRARNRRVEFLFAAQPQPIAAWLARQRTIACLPQTRGTVEACPSVFKFRASQMQAVKPPHDAVTDIRTPQPAPATIVIETKKVDIDLTNHVYEFRAPE